MQEAAMHVVENDHKNIMIQSTIDFLKCQPALVNKDAAPIEQFVQSLYSGVPAELLATRSTADLSRRALELFGLAEQAIRSERSQAGIGNLSSTSEQRRVWQAALSTALTRRGSSASTDSIPNINIEYVPPD